MFHVQGSSRLQNSLKFLLKFFTFFLLFVLDGVYWNLKRNRCVCISLLIFLDIFEWTAVPLQFSSTAVSLNVHNEFSRLSLSGQKVKEKLLNETFFRIKFAKKKVRDDFCTFLLGTEPQYAKPWNDYTKILITSQKSLRITMESSFPQKTVYKQSKLVKNTLVWLPNFPITDVFPVNALEVSRVVQYIFS